MIPLRNVQVDVRTHGWCCVFDVRLALSRYGLALALRLSEQMDVWQVRGLWQMLDDSDCYWSSPTGAAPRGGAEPVPAFSPGDEYTPDDRAVFDEWQAARCQSDLMGRMCWLGYAVEESMIPSEVDGHLDHRFGLLAEELETHWGDRMSRDQPELIHQECARDVVALAAALTRYKPFVLTRLERDDQDRERWLEPGVCQYLRQCGIPVIKAGEDERIEAMRGYLLQTLIATGALELVCASGLTLAALHVVAPKAYVIPAPAPGEEVAPHVVPIKMVQSREHRGGCWSGATAFWYPL